jgi:DNA-binding MarR family transcriptional regulator
MQEAGYRTRFSAHRDKIVWTTIVQTAISDSMQSSVQPGAGRRHFDSPQQEVFLNLWRTYDRLRVLEDELFRRFDLTAQQYNALRLLRSEHPGTLPTLLLARQLVSRAPDITRLLDKLEERGLVVRDRPQDNRRVVRVGITAAGLALLRTLRQPVRDCHARQFGHLSARDLERLAALLRAARAPHEDPGSVW